MCEVYGLEHRASATTYVSHLGKWTRLVLETNRLLCYIEHRTCISGHDLEGVLHHHSTVCKQVVVENTRMGSCVEVMHARRGRHVDMHESAEVYACNSWMQAV